MTEVLSGVLSATTLGDLTRHSYTTPPGQVPTPVVGDVNVAVLLLDFPDKKLVCTPGEMQQILFSEVNALYKEASGGRVSFSGQVFGPFDLPYASKQHCISQLNILVPILADPLRHAAAGLTIAAQQGIDLASYDRVLFVVARRPAHCKTISFGTPTGDGKGLSVVTGSELYASLGVRPSCRQRKLVAHELGHTFGMDHANTPKTATSSGEYGDYSGIMGGILSWPSLLPVEHPMVHFNAPHKYQMGWLPPGRIKDVTASGVHLVGSNAAVGGSLPKVLRVAIPQTTSRYYISLRTPHGFDKNLGPRYQQKVQVHRMADPRPPYMGIPTTVFDPTVLHANLRLGESFAGAAAGVKVKVLARGSTWARVQLTFDNEGGQP